MALDSVWLAKYQNDAWFQSHPAAWAIVKDGVQEISSKKPTNYNMQCLLSNMCAYGNVRWQYEPGSKVNVENTLKGTYQITDCGSLANIFVEIAKHLGFTGAVARKIKKAGHRIVTKPGVVTFNGKAGDATIEGRWCFGDHWVVEVSGLCYDPTFKFMGYPFAEVGDVYLGWYAKEERDPTVFTGMYWKADPNVTGAKNMYMRMFPNVAYTFKKTDKAGNEL